MSYGFFEIGEDFCKRIKRIGRGEREEEESGAESETCPEKRENDPGDVFLEFNREIQLLYEWLISYS